MEGTDKDLVIIGSGPAGLGAALYAARAGLDFLLVDKAAAGGQIMNTEFIENYLGFKGEVSGFELVQSFLDHTKLFDIETEVFFEIKDVKTVSKGKKPVFRITGEEKEITARSIIAASGAYPKSLKIKGESNLIGKGISFCATCDAALYRDKEVAVVGGGDTAIEEALFLTKFAKKVYVIHRRDKLRAVKLLQERAFSNEKIDMIWDSIIEEFSGKDHLEEITILNKKTSKKQKRKIDGVFEYIGWMPNSGFLSDIVETDKEGFIKTGRDMSTSMAGIYAAGDVRDTPLRQVITAVSDGAVASMSVDKYLNDLP